MHIFEIRKTVDAVSELLFKERTQKSAGLHILAKIKGITIDFASLLMLSVLSSFFPLELITAVK